MTIPEYEDTHKYKELHKEKECQHAQKVPHIGEGHPVNEGCKEPGQGQSNRHIKNTDND